jgi:CII-binding regulator of phage lambda lysogenization HflD
MKAGSELLALATGSPTSIVGLGDSTQLETVLREAPDEVRTAVLTGLRAALQWREQNGHH